MTDSTILITGANRGIGLELSAQFAADGWAVIACCRNPREAGALQALGEEHATLEIHALDVTDYPRMTELSRQLADRRVDILLSNAGVYGPKGVGFGDVDPVDWRQVLEVNTIADNGSGGSYLYRSSKTAVNQVVKCLSIDLAERGISALSLHPGWVLTDMGGPNTEIDVTRSVSGLKQILQLAGRDQSGRFLEFNGAEIPW